VGASQAAGTSQSACGKLSGVQAARGIAALMVVAYHTTRSLALPQYIGHVAFGNAFGFGHAGVDFFFVLSGFIITHAHVSDIGQPWRFNRYLWRRITRIYPLYWFVTGVEIFRAIFSPDVAARLAPIHLLNSLLLLPSTDWPLVSVAWTLQFEMVFYTVFALAILSRWLCIPLIVASALLITAGTIFTSTSPWMSIFVSPFNILFLMGIVTARLLANRRMPDPAILLTAGISIFLLTGIAEVRDDIPLNGLLGRALYGSGSVAILAGLVEAERSGSIRFGAVGVLMGDASYCLYLSHLSIIPLLVRICSGIGLLTAVPVTVVVVLLIVASVLAGLALHLLVEAPMMMFIRKHTPRAMK
jgi:exopolysaccharide production protein ExoZ